MPNSGAQPSSASRGGGARAADKFVRRMPICRQGRTARAQFRWVPGRPGPAPRTATATGNWACGVQSLRRGVTLWITWVDLWTTLWITDLQMGTRRMANGACDGSEWGTRRTANGHGEYAVRIPEAASRLLDPYRQIRSRWQFPAALNVQPCRHPPASSRAAAPTRSPAHGPHSSRSTPRHPISKSGRNVHPMEPSPTRTSATSASWPSPSPRREGGPTSVSPWCARGTPQRSWPGRDRESGRPGA